MFSQKIIRENLITNHNYEHYNRYDNGSDILEIRINLGDKKEIICLSPNQITIYYPDNKYLITYKNYVKLMALVGIKVTRKKNFLYWDGDYINSDQVFSFNDDVVAKTGIFNSGQMMSDFMIKNISKKGQRTLPISYLEANSPFVFGKQQGCQQTFDQTFGGKSNNIYSLIKNTDKTICLLYKNILLATYSESGDINFNPEIMDNKKYSKFLDAIKGSV